MYLKTCSPLSWRSAASRRDSAISESVMEFVEVVVGTIFTENTVEEGRRGVRSRGRGSRVLLRRVYIHLQVPVVAYWLGVILCGWHYMLRTMW